MKTQSKDFKQRKKLFNKHVKEGLPPEYIEERKKMEKETREVEAQLKGVNNWKEELKNDVNEFVKKQSFYNKKMDYDTANQLSIFVMVDLPEFVLQIALKHKQEGIKEGLEMALTIFESEKEKGVIRDNCMDCVDTMWWQKAIQQELNKL